MPNRIIKDSICTSPNIDQLSRDAEVFFYRLIVQCDDYGRMDARLPILRAKCYPLQIDKVTQDDIKVWLAELVQAELVILYTVSGSDYLQMRTWERHQQVRAKRSKYPEMQASDINCDQVQSDAPVIQSNPIQSESDAQAQSNDDETRRTKFRPKEDPIVAAVVAKMEDSGIGLSTTTVDYYVEAAQQYGLQAVLSGITAAVERGKQHRVKYVLACIEDKAQGKEEGKPPASTVSGKVAGFKLSSLMEN
jgi:hypothetical protein